MAQIICKNVSIGYEAKPLIQNLNFKVEQGQYLCILGENGAGKTTFLKTLLQLIPPLEGDIIWENQGRLGMVGYLPQQTEVQKDFPASVWEIVLSGCQQKKWWIPFYSSQDKQRALDSLEKMGIASLKKRCYRELSGGQQQRVLLARALCATHNLLILDEPISGLDPKATNEMYDTIRQLNQQGITILMISHDVSAVLQDASHILYLGKTIFFGTKQEYVNSDIAKNFTCCVEGCEQ